MTHPSTPTLHRYRYGELGADETRSLKAHLEACPLCARRLGLQEAERQAFVLQPVPASLKARSPSRVLRWAWMPALGLVAALLVAVPFLKPWEILGMGPPSERVKGAVASLEVFADRDGRSLPLAPGASVLPGDRLQIRFDPGPYPFATFAGRDATGEVEIYRSLAVQGSGFRAAPFALELDDTPGDQELFAIFSREAPTAASVRDLLEGILSLRDAVVASIHLRKEDAP